MTKNNDDIYHLKGQFARIFGCGDLETMLESTGH
jgi:hypothetical protein